MSEETDLDAGMMMTVVEQMKGKLNHQRVDNLLHPLKS